jgi:hypothetical protein
MKRWKKLFLVLLALVLLSQIPFAYRRYRLGRLNAAIQQLNSQRALNQIEDGTAEFKGVVHVHSFLGGHSSGNFEEIISAAQANQLDFVIMTEHPAQDFDTAEMTLKGGHGGVLFVNGNEVRTANGDRLLLIPGETQSAGDGQRSTTDVLSQRASGLALVAYPRDFKSWETAGYNGVEVYNVYTNARQINPLVMFFDGLWSYRSYPDLLFANFYRRPTESLQKWDEVIRQKGKSFVATAGNDAHANIGLSLNDSSGNTWVGFKLDPYERSFRLVRLHVLEQWPLNGQMSFPPPLDEARLLSDISAGHCYIGFDLFGDTSGFRYTARDADEARMMGDEIKLENEVQLTVSLPVPGRIVLLKDGTVIRDDTGMSTKDYTVTEKGSYRVEVYLPQLPKPAGEQPWIMSNPIYVR